MVACHFHCVYLFFTAWMDLRMKCFKMYVKTTAHSDCCDIFHPQPRSALNTTPAEVKCRNLFFFCIFVMILAKFECNTTHMVVWVFFFQSFSIFENLPNLLVLDSESMELWTFCKESHSRSMSQYNGGSELSNWNLTDA